MSTWWELADHSWHKPDDRRHYAIKVAGAVRCYPTAGLRRSATANLDDAGVPWRRVACPDVDGSRAR